MTGARPCDCCKREDHPVEAVVSSAIGPVSFGFCADCIIAGAEPIFMLRHLKSDVANGNNAALKPDALRVQAWKDGRYQTLDELWEEL